MTPYVPFFRWRSHCPIFSIQMKMGLWWVTGSDGARHIHLFSLSLLVSGEKDVAGIQLVAGPFHMVASTPWLSALLLKYL